MKPMTRSLDELGRHTFDLIVVGGGIFGACAAWDAAQRGLTVALLERGDFGGATSANSLKMVHGGIRYVQHLDIPRVRHSAAERRTLLKIAPHLVSPLPIVIPTYGHGMKGKGALRVGMGLFDLMTLDANRGLTDPSRRIPWCTTLNKSQTLEMYPDLEQRGLTGAALFSDAQMYNPCRLVLAFVQKAVEAGAIAFNHVEVTSLQREGRAVTGVKATDRLTGRELQVDSRAVLNAAGPYAERLLADAGQDLQTDLKLKEKITYSRDTAFVVKRKLTHPGHAIALQGTTADPDAKLGRGARHMFVAPWRDDYTLVGVWHVVYGGDPQKFTVTQRELQIYIDEMNQIYPAWNLKLQDIALWNAGLVPFGDNPDGASHAEGQDLKYGHRSHLIDHARDHGLDNLVTLIGVRYTTGRYEAVHAVDMVCRKLGGTHPPSQTHRVPVAGGEVEDVADLVRDVQQQHERLSPQVCQALVRNYGSRVGRVLAVAERDAALAQTLGDSTTIMAQVVYAVRCEMALTLGDVVFRRTDLATGGYPGRAALRRIADWMAVELRWSADETATQIAEVEARFPAWSLPHEASTRDQNPAGVAA